MADDTRNAQGETPLEAAIADFWAMEAQRGVTQADLDKVIAAVRAEPCRCPTCGGSVACLHCIITTLEQPPSDSR